MTTNRPTIQVSDCIDKFLPLAECFPQDNQPSIASIDPNNNSLIAYDKNNVRTVGSGAANATSLEQLLLPPQPQPAYLINTRSVKSTLQRRWHAPGRDRDAGR